MKDLRDSLLLSIVVPFHDSRQKADRLLATLASLDDPELEMVMVDDGSKDDTYAYLEERSRSFRCAVRLIRQPNKGPGGARNAGLSAARGRYVWFVDSDDNIRPEAIGVLRDLADRDYDFIDFALVTTSVPDLRGTMSIGDMKFPKGAHKITAENRLNLLRSFGKMVTKIYRRAFLVDAGVAFPEYCIYEDSVFLFKCPMMVKSFRRSDVIGYEYYPQHESATRSHGSKPPRFYDRLPTASYGFQLAKGDDCSPEERRMLEDKFTRITLVHTVSFVREADGDWRMILRVMRWFREEAEKLGITRSPIALVSGSRAYRTWFKGLWLASRFLPSQHAFFERLHLSVWGRPIQYRSALADETL